MLQDELQLGAQVPNYKHYTIMQNVNRSGQEAMPIYAGSNGKNRQPFRFKLRMGAYA